MKFPKNITPVPDWLVCAPCKDVMLWPEIQNLTCTFATAVREQSIEHLLVVESSGRIRQKKGTSSSVSNVSGVKSLVFFSIHNHPNPKNQAEAFLHPSDLGASFLSTNQCFSTSAMLLQVSDNEHLIAARFKPTELRRLLMADKTVLESLRQTIDCLHATPKGQWFYDRMMRSQTIFELAGIYKEEFPMLDFEIFEVDASQRKLNLR